MANKILSITSLCLLMLVLIVSIKMPISFAGKNTAATLPTADKLKLSKIIKTSCNKCHSMTSFGIGKLPVEEDPDEEDEEEEDGETAIAPPDLSTLSKYVLTHAKGPKEYLKLYLKKKIPKGTQKHSYKFKGDQKELLFLIDSLIKISTSSKVLKK